MINRIRALRKEKGWTLADLAAACDPPTTAQTIGRLETGMRNVSLKWMDRIGAALGVDPETIVRSDAANHPQIVGTLEMGGVEPLLQPRDAVLPTELGGDAPLMALAVEAAAGPYQAGDTVWLRQLDPTHAARAINRDVLVPRKGGRFAFGRLIDRQGTRVGVLPVGAGQKQQVIDDPAWIAVAEMLVRRL